MNSDKVQNAKSCQVEGRSTIGCFIFPPMSFSVFHQACERDHSENQQPSTQHQNIINQQMQLNASSNQYMIAINIHCLYRLLSSQQKHQGQQTRMTDKLLWLLFGHNQGQEEKDSTLIHSFLIKASDLFQIILALSVHRRASESIIERFRKQHLEDCIQQITAIPPSISINSKQIENLLMTIERRQREIMVQLNLTKLGGKRLSQIANQGTHCQRNNLTGIDTQSLQLYAGMLKSKGSDVMTLKMEWPDICKHLTSILSNWKMYEYDCGAKTKELIQLLEYKDCKFRLKLQSKDQIPQHFYLLDYLCPKLSYLVSAFNSLFRTKDLRDTLNQKQKQAAELAKQANQKKEIQESKYNQAYSNAMKELKGELKAEQNVLDKLTVDYFSELQSISKGSGSFFVKVNGFQKKPLKEFIGEIIQCQQLSFHWDDIFNLITLNATKITHPSNSQHTEHALEAITRCKYPDPSCLGCAQFFLLNKSIINCYNNTPIRIFPDLSFGLHRQELLDELCLMLNSNGGVILFSCAREYGSILPKGAYIKEDGREEKRREIIGIIESSIQPIVDVKNEVVVSFVPIVENVREEGSEEIRLQAIQDAFVMRIKVCSNDRTIHYICPQLSSRNKERDPPTKPKKSHPFRSKTFGNPLNHTCKEVMELQKLQAIDKIFSHMSMVVIKQEYTQYLMKELQKFGKSCYIQFKFQDYGFNIAKFTAAMYHNDSLEQILKLINQKPKEFTIEDKKVLVIYITDYLKIQMPDKLNGKDLENAVLWLRKQFPTQGLKYYYLKKPKEQQQQVKQGAQLQEYYIKAESKLSTLYMYYVFNHFKVKTVFKNPPSSEQPYLQEIKQNF